MAVVAAAFPFPAQPEFAIVWCMVSSGVDLSGCRPAAGSGLSGLLVFGFGVMVCHGELLGSDEELVAAKDGGGTVGIC